MRSTTNLAWPVTPFGAGQRPFGKARPIMAAVGAGWAGYVLRPVWACAVYLNTDSTRTVSLDGQGINVGFEVLTTDSADRPAALAERLDDLLVTCRRKAKFLVGHNLALDLDRFAIFSVDRGLPGVDGVRQQWTDRTTKGRGMARMFDTAHDLGLPAPCELAAAAAHASIKVATVADPEGSTLPTTVRHALTRTLAVALVAARATGKYDWTTPIDVDQLVDDAAWDRLADLGKDPAGDAGGITSTAP